MPLRSLAPPTSPHVYARTCAAARTPVELSFLSLFALLAGGLLTGCGQSGQAPQNSQETAAPAVRTYAGEGRDRLCLAADGTRAGFITYAAKGDTNCTVRGSIAPDGALIPDGDERCRIALARRQDSASLGAAGPACAYYCGPSASFAGKTFRATATAEPVVDLAGDPLC